MQALNDIAVAGCLNEFTGLNKPNDLYLHINITSREGTHSYIFGVFKVDDQLKIQHRNI